MNRNRRILGLILMLGLLLRIAAACYWHGKTTAEDHYFRFGDSLSYWVLASHIAAGEPYEYGSSDASIFRAPLLPLLLAPFTRIPNSSHAVLAVRLLGALIGVATVWLISLLARNCIRPTTGRTQDGYGSNQAGWFAAGLAAVYPSAIGMSVMVLSEMLFIPLMCIHLLLWQRAWKQELIGSRVKWSLLAGVTAGLAVLTRPSWLLFVPFLAGLGLLFGPKRIRHATIFAGTVIGLVAVMTPWWIRNASITGKFVLTTLQVGPSLYDGLHEGATGASDEGMLFMRSIVAQQQLADAQSSEPLESTLEWRINRRAQKAATEWALANPGQVAQLAYAKFLRTWSFWPDGGDAGSPSVRLAITLSCIGILLLALYASSQLVAANHWVTGVCWAPCLYFTLLHMVFVGSIRYREPAMIVLIGLAGCAISLLIYKDPDRGNSDSDEPGRQTVPSPQG